MSVGNRSVGTHDILNDPFIGERQTFLILRAKGEPLNLLEALTVMTANRGDSSRRCNGNRGAGTVLTARGWEEMDVGPRYSQSETDVGFGGNGLSGSVAGYE